MAFVADIELCLSNLDAKMVNNHGNLTAAKRIEWKNEFHGIIQFHTDATQLSLKYFILKSRDFN